ncbi:MAG: hypothetical protein PUA90_04530 [bacterium]|nr:hypothetical protein [bacterium]
MKKILSISLIVLSLFGCSLMDTPSSKVESYLNNYVSLEDEVLSDLDATIENEKLSENNKSIYKQVLKRQYQDLKYEIKDETIDGKNASVVVKITVYDLYKSNVNSEYYLNEHQDEFYTIDNTFDSDLYDKYKLDEMLKIKDTIDYEITFDLVKEDNTWVIKEPSREVLEKLHGLYNYNE